MKHDLTPEMRAYIAYCDWCDFLDVTPADLETWRKTTKNLSETNYSHLEIKRRSGRDVIA